MVLLSPDVTIFKKTTFGYRQDKTVSRNIIKDIEYQVFKGRLVDYPGSKKENETLELFNP